MAAIEMKLTGVDGVLETLKSLPAEVVSKRGGPVKTALRKGALVIHKAAKANLQLAVSNATATGKRESTGLLLKNLVVTRGKAPSGGKGERYLVRVKRKTYPGRNKVSTLKTAQILEYGAVNTNRQPAEPWLRPAFLSKASDAIGVIEKELIAGIDRAVKKLAIQNRGK